MDHAIPDTTQDSVTAVAAEIRDDHDTAWDRAAAIYETGRGLDYGLSGALEQRDWARYPDELNGQANCHEVAVRSYLLADALDLEPRFFRTDLGIDHRFIDVQAGDDRIVVDPFHNVFGPVQYDDTRRSMADNDLTNKTQDEYGYIQEMDAAAVIDEFDTLRESPAGMLRNRQKLGEVETDTAPVKDWLRYDEDDEVLERWITRYSDIGFRSPMVRVTYDAATGEQTETVYSTMESFGFNYCLGSHDLTDADGDLVTALGDLPDPVREDILKRGQYEQQAGDGLLYTAAERDAFWETYRDRQETLWEDHTGFFGREVWNAFTWIRDRADDQPDRFDRVVDWLLFLDDHADQDLPDDDQVAELLPAYLDQHRTIHDLADDRYADAVAAAVDGITDSYTPSAADPEPVPDRIAEQGIAAAYQDLADAVAADASITDWHPLLAVDPTLRGQLDDLVADDTAITDLGTPVQEQFPDAPYTGEREWTYDPGQRQLTHEIRFDDAVSAYATRIDTVYTFDRTGDLTDRRLRIRETTEHCDDAYVLVDRSIDDIDDVTIADLQTAAVDRLETIQDRSVLDAPQPTMDTDFLAKNRVATAVYSRFKLPDDDLDRLFPDDDLDAFRDRLTDEYETVADSPYRPVDDRQEAAELRDLLLFRDDLVDDLEAMDADDLDAFQDELDAMDLSETEQQQAETLLDLADQGGAQAALDIIDEYNLAVSRRQNDRYDPITDAVRGRYTPEEQLEQYMKQCCDPFEDVLWTDTYADERDTLIDHVATGIQQQTPSAATIDAAVTALDAPLGATLAGVNDRIDASIAWSWKGPELAEQLAALPEQYDAIQRDAETTVVADALDGFAARLTDRRRYQDWTAATDIDLVDRIDAAQDALADVSPRTVHRHEDAAALAARLAE